MGCFLALAAAGCARAPAPAPTASGARALENFLAAYARPEAASRGAGILSLRRGEESQGTLDLRWATEAESLAVVGYVGPVRALDASFFGDSLYVGLRPIELGLAGSIPREEGLGPRGLRFLARPWDFSPTWIRAALEHASVDPWEDGWRVAGVLVGEETNPFSLELDRSGEPRRLRIGRPGGAGTLVTIRYGEAKGYDGGRLPRSVEWVRGPSTVRLEIDQYTRPKPSKLRRSPPADPGWTLLSLDDPRSRALLRRFLGIGADEEER